jgi:hypothetical protein
LTSKNSPLNPNTPLGEPNSNMSIQNITSPNDEVYREEGILTPGKDKQLTVGGSSNSQPEEVFDQNAMPKINIDVAPVFNVIGDNNNIKELPINIPQESNNVETEIGKPIIFKNAAQIEAPTVAEPMEPDFKKGIINIKKIE